MDISVPETVILGIGSPFGADRLGWIAIDQLRLRGLEAPGVRLIVADRPGVRLLELVRGAHAMILIDALQGAGRPGSLRLIPSESLASEQRVSNHGFGVADALALGRVLGALPDRVAVIGIEMGALDAPEVDWEECAALVRKLLRENGRAKG